MSRTIEQLTQEIISVANSNNEKANILFRGIDRFKSEVHAELDCMLSSMISMDLDALHNDLESIAAKLYRRRTELQRIAKIISSLPNVRDHRAGQDQPGESKNNTVAGSGASTCWADSPLDKE